MSAYRLLTNFKTERLNHIYIAVTAVGITDYQIVRNAVDVFNQPLPTHYALYFKNTVSQKDTELFFKALHMANEQLKEKGDL